MMAISSTSANCPRLMLIFFRKISVRQSLQEIAHMHLVGFVIAGERVHDEIDAAAECQLVLALAAGREGVKGLAVLIARPANRKIVRGDDDGRDAVARPRRAGASVGRGGGKRLDPRRPLGVAAKERCRREAGAATWIRVLPPRRGALKAHRGCRKRSCRPAS